MSETTHDKAGRNPAGEAEPRRADEQEAVAGAQEPKLGEADAPAQEDASDLSAPSAEEHAEIKDRLLRTLAEMENLRKRSEREIEDARKYAVTSFARGLLDVADNLSRALASIPAEQRERDEFLKNFVVGVEMTERTLMGLFEKNRISKVTPQKGEKFDSARHQAMFEVPTNEVPPGTIAETLQPGFVIAERLLRPAMVGVAKAAPAQDGGPGSTVDTSV